jgi:hypothetical protein
MPAVEGGGGVGHGGARRITYMAPYTDQEK